MIAPMLAWLGLGLGCPAPDRTTTTAPDATPTAPTDADAKAADTFKVQTEQFGDVRILRYRVPGFEELPLQ